MSSQFERRRGSQSQALSGTIRFALGCVARLSWFYRLLGVDHVILVELVRTKWILEDRRRSRSTESGLRKLQMWAMTLLYGSLGLLLGGVAFVMEGEVVAYMGIATTTVFVLLLLPLLSDLCLVLFDTSDVELLSSLPMADRTVTAARVTMMLIYLGLLVGALGFGPVVLGCVAFPSLLFVPMMLVALLQAAVLAVGVVLVLYLTALKTLDLAKFRDALVYAQVGSVLAVFVLLQLGPRLAIQFGLVEWYEAHSWIRFGLPTLAPGALMRVISGDGAGGDLASVLSGFGFTLMVIACFAVLARDGIVSQLAQLESSGGRAQKSARRYGVTGWLGRRCMDPTARAGWYFFLAQVGSDRAFKMRVAPSLAAIILPWIGIVIGTPDDWGQASTFVCYFPYMFVLIPGLVWEMARFSESWEGRWIFEELSDADRPKFVSGGMQAMLLRTNLAPVLALSALSGALFGLEAFTGTLFAAALSSYFALWFLPFVGTGLPFTERATTQSSTGGNALLGIGMMLCMFLLGALHYGIGFLPLGYELGLVLMGVLSWRAWRRFSETLVAAEHRVQRKKRKRPARAT